jgi:hypothetical protein
MDMARCRVTDVGKITVKRAEAARARRVATGLANNADRARIMNYADALDAQADALEKASQQNWPSCKDDPPA